MIARCAARTAATTIESYQHTRTREGMNAMFARVSQYLQDPDGLDAAVRFGEDNIVSQLQTAPGFLGLEFMIDRVSGRALSITYWVDEEAVRATESLAGTMRQRSSSHTGARTAGTSTYEVVVRVGDAVAP